MIEFWVMDGRAKADNEEGFDAAMVHTLAYSEQEAIDDCMDFSDSVIVEVHSHPGKHEGHDCDIVDKQFVRWDLMAKVNER